MKGQGDNLWHWEVRDRSRRSGWRQLTWMMSEDQAGTWARANCAQIRRLKSTREDDRHPQGAFRIEVGAELRFYRKPKSG